MAILILTIKNIYTKIRFKIYINGILKETKDCSSNVTFEPFRVHKLQPLFFGIANVIPGAVYAIAPRGTEILKYDLKKGDIVSIKMSQLGSNALPLNFLNGASVQLRIRQDKSSKLSVTKKVLFDWDYDKEVFSPVTNSFEPVDNFSTELAEMTVAQADNFIRMNLAAMGIGYDEAVKKKVNHICGTEQNVQALAAGSMSSSYASWHFTDLFFIPNSTLARGDDVMDVFGAGTSSGPAWHGIRGRVGGKVGDLYAIGWYVGNDQSSYDALVGKRKFTSSKVDWMFLNYEKCTSNTAPNIQPSPMPTPSLTPPPSASPISILPSGVVTTSKNTPYLWQAFNVGPWTGNRPGYTCPSGGMYGTGTFSWGLASPTGSFPYWSGPLFTLRCLSGANSAIQTWKVELLGWSTCQGPTYSALATKQQTGSVLEWTLGSGTLKLFFT